MVHGWVVCISHELDRFTEVAEKLLIVQKMSLQLVQLSGVVKVCCDVGRFLQEPSEHR